MRAKLTVKCITRAAKAAERQEQVEKTKRVQSAPPSQTKKRVRSAPLSRKPTEMQKSQALATPTSKATRKGAMKVKSPQPAKTPRSPKKFPKDPIAPSKVRLASLGIIFLE